MKKKRATAAPQSIRYACSILQQTSADVSIRQHTSAYVSIRQHTSAYVSIRQHTSAYAQHTCLHASPRLSLRLAEEEGGGGVSRSWGGGGVSRCLQGAVGLCAAPLRDPAPPATCIRQQTSAYAQHTSAYVSICQHTSAYVFAQPH